ncbi:MAG: hypothetical protein WAK93_02695 [Solirubrobacteraceae bacterium]
MATGATLLLGSGAMAAQASAATLFANKACYVNDNPAQGAPMLITGTGFTPGDTVDLSGGTVFAKSTVQSNGTIAWTAAAPLLTTIDPASETTTLTADDETVGANVASGAVQSANLAVATSKGQVQNVHKDKVKFSFSGFSPGKSIYGFYARTKIVAKTNFGKAKGACGMLTKRALLFPGGHPRNNSYKVTFESRSKYSKKANPRLTAKLKIFRF